MFKKLKSSVVLILAVIIVIALCSSITYLYFNKFINGNENNSSNIIEEEFTDYNDELDNVKNSNENELNNENDNSDNTEEVEDEKHLIQTNKDNKLQTSDSKQNNQSLKKDNQQSSKNNNFNNNSSSSNNNTKDESNSIQSSKEKSCTPKKFIMKFFRADFDNFEECKIAGEKLTKNSDKYVGYVCNNMPDDCNVTYYMLSVFDEDSNYYGYDTLKP